MALNAKPADSATGRGPAQDPEQDPDPAPDPDLADSDAIRESLRRPERFAVGEKVDAKITAIDRSARKLSLTIKGREVEEEKQAMAEFGSSDSGASLGDILGAAIRRRNQQSTDA